MCIAICVDVFVFVYAFIFFFVPVLVFVDFLYLSLAPTTIKRRKAGADGEVVQWYLCVAPRFIGETLRATIRMGRIIICDQMNRPQKWPGTMSEWRC